MLKAIVAIATIWGATASAASFDCKSAATPRERLICATPALSDADEKLAQSYKDALSGLSPEGRAAVKDGQRSWLTSLAAICSMLKSANSQALKNQIFCLNQEYKNRMISLKSVVSHEGPYVFVKVEHYKGITSNGADRRSAQQYSAYPRIDSPLNSKTERWNALIEHSYELRHQDDNRPSDDSDCDKDDDYEIDAATPDLISVRWKNYFYCQPTPHGYDESDVETFMMLPEPHPMAPADLFIPDADWAGRLASIVTAKLEYLVYGDKSVFNLSARATIDAVAEDPTRWQLTKDGIEVIFQPYELNMGRGFPGEPIMVGWSEISDILRKDIQLH